MDVIYSTEKLEGLEGRTGFTAVNPQFFIAPVEDAKRVYLNGDYPALAKAYEEAGIPVLPYSEMPKPRLAAAGTTQKEA